MTGPSLGLPTLRFRFAETTMSPYGSFLSVIAGACGIRVFVVDLWAAHRKNKVKD